MDVQGDGKIGIEKRQTCRNAGTQSFGTGYAFEKDGYGRPAAIIMEILYGCSLFFYGQDVFADMFAGKNMKEMMRIVES